MEHVNKEKPFESRFFEPPEPGDAELQEEEMNDIGTTAPCDEKEGTTLRLSPGLTRLIEEQGVNRYKLRSGEDSGKGAIRHHAAKSKIMKPDRGRRKKQSEPGDKENRPINMTSNPEEETLSGHVVGDVNIDDRSNDGAIMHNSLHGDVPEPKDSSETQSCMQVSNGVEEMHLGRHTSSVCDEVLVDGEEQEVSSDQSTKYRSCTDMECPKVRNCNIQERTNIVGFFPGITHVREQVNQRPISIIYPDKWVDIGGEGDCVEEWGRIVNRNNECLEKENYLGIEETRKHMQSAWSREIEGLTTTFCYNNNLTTLGLKNWLGSHTSLGRVGKRKMRNNIGQQQLLIEIGDEDYDLNVGTSGMRKKKNTMSRKEIQDPQSQGDIWERINSKDTHVAGIARKFWRIWSSRNRKPEKNLSKNTYQFQQEFIPRMITQDPILIKEFNFGKGKGKEVQLPAKGLARSWKLKEKEARLLEIAKNINTTSANSKLINSIMGLARSRITRTPTRMNPGPTAGRGITDHMRQVTTQRNNYQPEMRNRNVMIGGKPMDIPESSRANEHTNPYIENLKNPEEHGGQEMYKPSDEEGNELESGMGIGTEDNREDINLVELNAGWARKQERNLNISYSQTLNQDQRIEAKGYGEGFRWASYVREEESEFDGSNAAVHSQNGDEVDSESDATASFMKDDISYRYSAPSDGLTNVDGVEQTIWFGSSTRRFSTYGSTKGVGALRGKGKGANWKEKDQNKYFPMLSEIRVNDFVQETTAIGDRRKGGDSSVTLGLNPSEEGATDDGFTCRSPVGHATVTDTEMEGSKHLSSPANTQVTVNGYGKFSPRKDSNDIQSIIWDSNKGHYNLSGRIHRHDSVTKEFDLNTQRDPHQLANSVWNSPVSGLESFAEKIKKSNEIIGLQLEYFPPSISPDGGCRIHISQEDLKLSARVYSLHLQAPAGQNEKQLGKATQTNQVSNKHGVLKPPTVVPNATKKVSWGFNFTIAVQGDKGGKNQQSLSSKIATPSKSIDIDSSNRFSVLDIPNSIKLKN
ncbi:hypothetical protein L1987_73049 [Smallanthus sonchifolius]|uniref:Uncharacterized protein n=1 Tax=Smallanthus sonchifolius TaxID=185202 RepID=A0ACB9AX65_9ASTR|nr:hypothetical protein L1987_73049 [Smallanthus sonchifolius]